MIGQYTLFTICSLANAYKSCNVHVVCAESSMLHFFTTLNFLWLIVLKYKSFWHLNCSCILYYLVHCGKVMVVDTSVNIICFLNWMLNRTRTATQVDCLVVLGQHLAVSPKLFNAPDGHTLWMTISMVMFGCFWPSWSVSPNFCCFLIHQA